MVEPGIFQFSELEKPTPATLQAMCAKIEELSAGLEPFGILIDLAESHSSTTGEYRRFIPRLFDDWSKRSRGALRQIALPIGSHAVLRVAAKFIIARIATAPFVVYRDRDEALRALRQALDPR